MLWSDKGSEFISKHFKKFLKKNKIKLYHALNEEKSSVVERWKKKKEKQNVEDVLHKQQLGQT